MEPVNFLDLVPKVFICKLQNGTVGFREAKNTAEVWRYYPDVEEAYELTESQEREIEAAWAGYWKHSQDLSKEPEARRLLAAICRSVFMRAKENQHEHS